MRAGGFQIALLSALFSPMHTPGQQLAIHDTRNGKWHRSHRNEARPTYLRDVITNDGPGLRFRVHFHGSRQQGTQRPASNLDLAIEFPCPMEDGEVLAYWNRFHSFRW